LTDHFRSPDSASLIPSTRASITRAAMVLADVLNRADQRAGDLASVADHARARGMTCERSYDDLSGGN
jgi:hypothetical protein